MQYVIWNETKKAYWNGFIMGEPVFVSDINAVLVLYSENGAKALCEDDEIAVPVNITRADQDNLRPKEETTR